MRWSSRARADLANAPRKRLGCSLQIGELGWREDGLVYQPGVHALADQFDRSTHRDHPDDLHRLWEHRSPHDDVGFQVLWIHRKLPTYSFAVAAFSPLGRGCWRVAGSRSNLPLPATCTFTEGQDDGMATLVSDPAVRSAAISFTR